MGRRGGQEEGYGREKAVGGDEQDWYVGWPWWALMEQTWSLGRIWKLG